MPVAQRNSRRSAMLALAVVMLLGVAGMELCLHAVTYIASRFRDNTPITIPEGKTFKMNPAHPEHDSRGYRNAEALTKADIVTLGDSQTYGLGVFRDESWPVRLSAKSGKVVYNMGVPGRGLADELIELPTALSLQPDVLIAVIYTGTNILDSYDQVYVEKDMLEFTNKDTKVLAELEHLETKRAISEIVNEAASNVFYPQPKSWLMKVKLWLSAHSKIYDVLAIIKNKLNVKNAWDGVAKLARENNYDVFENAELRTIFQSDFRGATLNYEDLRVKEGVRISMEIIQKMLSLSQNAGVKMKVVLIPTKEFVFRDIVADSGVELSQAYKNLMVNEARILEVIEAFMTANAIEYVNTTTALRELILNKKNPYFESNDGHPAPAGYEAIADSVYSFLSNKK